MFRKWMGLAVVLLALLSGQVSVRALPGEPGPATTREGSPILALVLRECLVRESLAPGAATVRCAAGRLFYVFPPDADWRPGGEVSDLVEKGRFRISEGESEAAVVGFIDRKDVVLWEHQIAMAARTASREGPALFYDSYQDAIASLDAGAGVVPSFRSPASSELLFPLLDARALPGRGTPGRCLKLALPFGTPETQKEDPEVSSLREFLETNTADLVFVVDTTSGMAPYIKELRDTVGEMVEYVARSEGLQDRVRLGLVAYRDAREDGTPGDHEYVARISCTLTEGRDHRHFLDQLSALHESPVKGDDCADDVLAGLHTAIQDPGMGWNDSAWKQLVLLTGSSAKEASHPRSPRNSLGITIDDVLRWAQPGSSSRESTPIGFVVVHARDPAALDDAEVAERQYLQLAAGRMVSVGRYLPVDPDGNGIEFSRELREILIDRMATFGGLVRRALRLTSSADRSDPTAGVPAALRGSVDRIQPGPTTREIVSGFATEAGQDGEARFVPHLLVNRRRLQDYLAATRFIRTRLEGLGDPPERGRPELLGSLQAATASLLIGVPVDPDMSYARLLRGLADLSYFSEVLRMSMETVVTLSSAEYEELVRQLGAKIGRLQGHVERVDLWFTLGAAGDPEKDAFAFIPLADVP